MTKTARQALLLEILRSRAVRTQEELAEALAARGAEASQVTLSRDLRELGVVKAPDGYREAEAVNTPAQEEQLARALRDFAISITPAASLVVIRTSAGAAGPLGLALDRSRLESIVGTIAGDDTIFVAAASAAKAIEAAKQLEELRQ